MRRHHRRSPFRQAPPPASARPAAASVGSPASARPSRSIPGATPRDTRKPPRSTPDFGCWPRPVPPPPGAIETPSPPARPGPADAAIARPPSHDETPGTGGSTPHTFARCAGNSAAAGRLLTPDRRAWPWDWRTPAPGGILPPLEVPYCARFALRLVLDKEPTAISTGTKIKR